jgi:hypothetical protein
MMWPAGSVACAVGHDRVNVGMTALAYNDE